MENKNSSIKIFVSCHKPSQVAKNPLLYPIQVGSKIAPKRFENMLHDDEGENISNKNKKYCELTAQYWVWKNVEADYYGFFHYRRYLSFSSERFETNKFGDAIFDCIDDDVVSKINCRKEDMEKMINEYDLIIPEKGSFSDDLTIYQQYEIADVHKIKDLDFVLNVINKKYPQMSEVANKYIHSTKGYFCNMFIMKKRIFMDYSKWLFDILDEFEKEVDCEDYDAQSYRVSGYLAERLCGIYLEWLNQNKDLKIKELQRTLFLNTEPLDLPKPAFKENNCAIVMTASNHFAPYLSAVIQSIIDNSTKKNNYDILILNKDINEQNKEKILFQIKNNPNFSIRFISVAGFVPLLKGIFTRGHFGIETYFRFFIQDVLVSYDKVLFLDADIIANSDVAELYNTDLENYWVGACKDADTAGLYLGGYYSPNKKHYMDNILKIKNPFEYFQAGVMLFNLKELRKNVSTKEMLEFALSYDWELLDQDVLNYFYQGHVKFVDISWNIMFDWRYLRIDKIISKAPHYLYDMYMEGRKNPKIIHYAGPNKPWENPEADLAKYFWKYIRRTEFYEDVIYREFRTSINNIAWEFNSKIPVLPEKISFKRKVLNFFLPVGSKRRKFVKKIFRRNKKKTD